MCGIAGWVDFDRDLAVDGGFRYRAVVDAMVASMACRGPDDEGRWIGPHAALGHRRLAVIDIEGGRQPMIVEGRATLTYSGEIYNFRELRQELRARGHVFSTASDTEVLLRGYLEWGEDVVDRINGMYAFAVWDHRREELLLVRDRLGVKPLFYYPLPGGVLFGSEPKAILAHPLVEPVVDADGLREILTLAHSPGEAIFRGMRELLPGHVLRVGRAGLSDRCYWQLPAREHTDDLDTTVTTIRGLLEDIVDRQLVSDVPLCSLLSGGLDSSAITALAAQRGGIRTFEVDFAGYTERFRPDAIRSEPDAPYVQHFVKHVGPDHTGIVLDPGELTGATLRATVVRALDQPTAIGDMNTSLYMLFRAIREHSTVALSGEAADEVFGGYAWFHLPQAVHADTFPWNVLLTATQTPADLLHPDLRRQLDLPGYLADTYRSALSEVPRLPGENGLEARMREICYLHLTRWLPMLLDRKDRLSMAVGLEVRVPFCDHRLVEYVFNTPWAYKTFDGREKSLLRAAVADLLPETILQRVKSPYPANQDPAYEQALRGQLAGLVTAGAPIAPLLDEPAVRKAATARASVNTTTTTRLNLEMVLDLNQWLASTQVDVQL